jgi:putative ABC transport system permease protein
MRSLAAFAADVRYATRALRRAPAFSLAAILTLALGIGANTAVFSVVNAVLLRPLPYGSPDRIVTLLSSWEGTPAGRLSPGEYGDYTRDARTLEHVGLFGATTMTMGRSGSEPELIHAGVITAGVLPALGVAPAAGRAFVPADEDLNTGATVILGDALWRQRFGASPSVLGTDIVLDGRPTRIVGVMPPEFRLPTEFAARDAAQLFIPMRFTSEQAQTRGNHSFNGVARLRSGVAVAAASAELGAIASAFSATMPEQYPTRNRFSARAVPVTDTITGDVAPALLLLFGAIGFVLLIACTNITSLVLSRADFHARDGAIRAALGAGRGRLVSYALAESGVIAIVGGGAGVAVAAAAMRVLPWLTPLMLPRGDSVSIDWRVLAFALALSIVVGVVVGLLPAFRAARQDPRGALAANARGSVGGGPTRMRQALVTAQVALAIVLVFGAALLSTSFGHLMAVDPGYRTDQVVAVDLTLPENRYPDGERTADFFLALLTTLDAQPNIAAAGAVANLPLEDPGGDLNIQIEGRDTPAGSPSRKADWQVVTPGYFAAVGTPLLRGRAFTRDDGARAPGVVVISETMAREYWPDTDPIGTRFRLGGGAGPGWVTVVGIVGDVRQSNLTDGARRQMYLAQAQFRFWGGDMAPARAMTIVTRASRQTAGIPDIVRREVRALDPALPLGAIRTMNEVRANSTASQRFLAFLTSGFSGTALFISLVGIYGVVAYAVSQRRREIGVRLALGATPLSIAMLVMEQGMRPVAIGLALGLAGGLASAGVLRAFLFQIDPRDPGIALGVVALVAAVTLLACLVPAARAARVDPTTALRQD